MKSKKKNYVKKIRKSARLEAMNSMNECYVMKLLKKSKNKKKLHKSAHLEAMKEYQ